MNCCMNIFQTLVQPNFRIALALSATVPKEDCEVLAKAFYKLFRVQKEFVNSQVLQVHGSLKDFTQLVIKQEVNRTSNDSSFARLTNTQHHHTHYFEITVWLALS